jgi:hypothetical protein
MYLAAGGGGWLGGGRVVLTGYSGRPRNWRVGGGRGGGAGRVEDGIREQFRNFAGRERGEEAYKRARQYTVHILSV